MVVETIDQVISALEDEGENQAAHLIRELARKVAKLEKEVAELEKENDTWNSHTKARTKRRLNDDE